MACFAAILLVAGWDVFRDSGEIDSVLNRPATTSPRSRGGLPAATTNDQSSAGDSTPSGDISLVDDDGQSLWVSPTAGEPLDVGYLPPGVQIIIALRPAALLQHPEGNKVRAALGPTGERAIQFVEDSIGLSLNDVDFLLCGCRATSEGAWQTTFVARLRGKNASDITGKNSPTAIQKEHHGEAYWLADERARYIPEREDDKILVVAPADSIEELIELAGGSPPLRRDLERLLSHTDADRHVTLVVAPNFLFSEGQSMFSGAMARLRAPLFWFLGDELSVAALSLHWDEDFFFELLTTPTLDTSPQRAARILSDRVKQVPERLEDYVLALQAHPYGRRVVSRFPGMVRKLATYMRSGFEADHAALRAYLPAVAGHNLLMGAELTLAEPTAGALVASDAERNPVAPAASPADDALKRVTSLAFTRDTLEAALEQLSQDIGVEIVIVGQDLQAEGITKNQSFSINIQEKPAGEILVQILRLANPDKTATVPHDARQKLVYVIAPATSAIPQHIQVTTRAAAMGRGDHLPKVFDAEGAEPAD